MVVKNNGEKLKTNLWHKLKIYRYYDNTTIKPSDICKQMEVFSELYFSESFSDLTWLLLQYKCSLVWHCVTKRRTVFECPDCFWGHSLFLSLYIFCWTVSSSQKYVFTVIKRKLKSTRRSCAPWNWEYLTDCLLLQALEKSQASVNDFRSVWSDRKLGLWPLPYSNLINTYS